MIPYNQKRKSRRTCYDRARKRWLEARRAQTNNPAASVALHLLGVFGFVIGRMPIATPMTGPYVAPTMSQRQEQRNETARRLGVPTRYLDIVLSQGMVPYALLLTHIRLGGATRRDALNELRKRMPAEALDWFDHVEKQELWSEFSRHIAKDASDEDIQVIFLKKTLAWMESPKLDVIPSEQTESESLSQSVMGRTTNPL
jgi:hypothetical protein